MAQRFGVDDALPMWVADMDFASPPEVIEALRRRVEHGVFGYTVMTDSYREALVGWLARRHRWTIEPGWISHAPGVVPALAMLIEAYTEPGDKVLIQPPVYYPFERVIRQNGRQVVYNPLRERNGRYEMDFDDLDVKLDGSVKLMILCSPHNPVGRVWTADELRRLGTLCRERGVFVIADEIHGDLVYSGHVHTPFASLDPAFAQCSATCVAPSKTFNLPGLHTAMVVIPDARRRHAYEQVLQRWSVGSLNPFGMVAAEAAYRHGDAWLDALLAYLAGNLDMMQQVLYERIPELRMVRPEGTYLVWLDCRGLGLPDKELEAFFLHKARVAFNPGRIFGPGGEGFMRVNIGMPRALVEEALDRIERAVSGLRQAQRPSAEP
jgi:cystathionine beta-lyase